MGRRGGQFVLLEVPEGRTLHYDNGEEVAAERSLEDLQEVLQVKIGEEPRRDERDQLFGGRF